MPETYHPLIATIAASIILAFVFGYLAKILRLPSILGYLVAGICIGPHTPGFVANQPIASQLAEIGVILLMFGVGLHFSLKDLLGVRRIALPGALFQMAAATTMGALFMRWLGYDLLESVAFGFTLSVASTVVLLRALENRHKLETESGRLAVGWLIVEDIAMVLAIVLLPVLAEAHQQTSGIQLQHVLGRMGMTLVNICALLVLMIVLGRKFLPVLLERVEARQSHELTTLCTLALALGFAYLAHIVFGASFALGAFLAGMVLNESEAGRKAGRQSLPLRDTFAVLFFVSVGMLFDPLVLMRNPVGVLVVLAMIVIGKSAAALVITTLFRQPASVSLVVAVSLAQIGEFSFIFAGMSRTLGLMSQDIYDLVLAGALLSIALNPFLFKLLDRNPKTS